MKHLFILIALVGLSCDGGSNSKGYTDHLNDGWFAFGQADYQAAFDSFSEAAAKKPNEAAPHEGMGWSLLKLGLIDNAAVELSAGSAKLVPSANLFAAWAFALNAQKKFANSNQQISQTLTMMPNWSFTRQPDFALDQADLHVMKAENHFLLGEFTQSLAEVKTLNASFTLNSVTTDADKAALAREIERLKIIS